MKKENGGPIFFSSENALNGSKKKNQGRSPALPRPIKSKKSEKGSPNAKPDLSKFRHLGGADAANRGIGFGAPAKKIRAKRAEKFLFKNRRPRPAE